MTKQRCLHINLYGSPGSGKSTNRSRLFYELKKKQYMVEEITEFAKEATYKEDFSSLSDQVLMLGKQHHLHKVLDNQVDYVITDSPFIMGIVYMDRNISYMKELKNLALAIDDDYETMNFFIERNHEYQEYGRNQTEQQANEKSDEIKKLLIENNIDFISVKSGKEFIKKALKKIKKYRKGKNSEKSIANQWA